MKQPSASGDINPALSRTSLIRELVRLSGFTDGILTAMGSAVVAVDDDGSVIYVNPAAETLLGQPGAALLHRPAAEVLRTRGGAPLLDEIPSPHAATEVELERADGTLVTVDVRLSRREPRDPDPGGVVAILTDRTDVKRAEQQARRQERLASLGELSAGVAHEIRNPLAGIASCADLLRARLGPEDERTELVKLILGEVGRLDRIVESLLKFARPPEPTLRRDNIVHAVARAVSLVQEEATRLGVEIETEYDAEVPEVWIDPDQMVQVFLNLMRNGLQAMSESGGRLVVRVRRVERAPYVRRGGGRRADDAPRPSGPAPAIGWVEIEVSDTGHGIAPEDVDRVFNPFYTTRKRGTGLGLSITQSIVQEHRGMITIGSSPGRGTTVRVDLPEEKRRRRRGSS